MYGYITAAKSGDKYHFYTLFDGHKSIEEHADAAKLFDYLTKKVTLPILYVDDMTALFVNREKLGEYLKSYTDAEQSQNMRDGQKYVVTGKNGKIYRANVCRDYAPGKSKNISFINFAEAGADIADVLEKFNIMDTPEMRLRCMRRFREVQRDMGITSRTYRSAAEKELLSLYPEVFPAVDDKIEKICRECYHGGIMFSDKITISEDDAEEVDAYDYNGLYSYCYSGNLPIGAGEIIPGDDERINSCQIVRFFGNATPPENKFDFAASFKICLPGADGLITAMKQDVETMAEYGYNINIDEIVDGVLFDEGEPMRAYFDKWESAKRSAENSVKRMISKKMLNVPAGALASRTKMRYIPAAAYITARARAMTAHAIHIAESIARVRVIYANTDSVHVYGTRENLDAVRTAFTAVGLYDPSTTGQKIAGALKLEDTYIKGTYKGVNNYFCINKQGVPKKKIGGLPKAEKANISYEDYISGKAVQYEMSEGGIAEFIL